MSVCELFSTGWVSPLTLSRSISILRVIGSIGSISGHIVSELVSESTRTCLWKASTEFLNTDILKGKVNKRLDNCIFNLLKKDRATSALRERLGITVQQVGELEEQLTRKDQEKNELERSLSTAQQILRDDQAQRSPDWVIPRNQIQLTTKSLGRGA